MRFIWPLVGVSSGAFVAGTNVVIDTEQRTCDALGLVLARLLLLRHLQVFRITVTLVFYLSGFSDGLFVKLCFILSF